MGVQITKSIASLSGKLKHADLSATMRAVSKTLVSNAVKKINAMYDDDNPERQVALDKVKNDFDFNMKSLEAWKEECEVQLTENRANKKALEEQNTTLLAKAKEEVKQDHSYGFS